MTGIWPRVPRRIWHVGPMARSVRDSALATRFWPRPLVAPFVGYLLDQQVGERPHERIRAIP
ncbi:MAG TPA: hypothetical protein VH209_13485 [Steroidobacteraceae bacterium]|nr:hypothetical protein [Steroidobacteraceae bacterium]